MILRHGEHLNGQMWHSANGCVKSVRAKVWLAPRLGLMRGIEIMKSFVDPGGRDQYSGPSP